ncbi:MAG: recombinase family protein [Hyphomicrobium sp.]|nr:recombinase family protein [Hyphomicrobium sp.]
MRQHGTLCINHKFCKQALSLRFQYVSLCIIYGGNSAVPTTYGYARVSTIGQTLEAQLEGLKATGCQRIFREKVSGARADRRELNKLLRRLQAGDAVVVTRIDRLARSTFDLFAIVKSIVDRKAQFCSLAEPWADTATSTGRLMIAVLGGLADVERDLIRTRTAEGRQRAKARGVKLGRKPKLTPQQKREALSRRTAGETLMDIARSYNVSFATISRLKP